MKMNTFPVLPMGAKRGIMPMKELYAYVKDI
jgi:hypothetical protein